MTKLRDPLSFSLAISTVTELIGWDRAAKLTRRAKRTVRHWSESDRKGTPTLDQAFALDREFIERGGGCAPILESYARQLDVVLADMNIFRTTLAEDLASATRETGEAFAFCIQAMQPGASPAIIQRAIREAEQADSFFPRLISHLKTIWRRNRAAPDATGERK